MSDILNREVRRSVEYIVSEVAQRGWFQESEEIDDFTALRADRRFREAQVTALYEQYFPPRRHEFEWQILEEIVRAIAGIGAGAVAAGGVRLVAESVAGGVVGNAAYDAIKSMCSFAAERFRSQLEEGVTERSECFEQIAKDAETLKQFFEGRDRARIGEIEDGTKISRDCIYPLLKLAGCIHFRRGVDRCNWQLPTQ